MFERAIKGKDIATGKTTVKSGLASRQDKLLTLVIQGLDLRASDPRDHIYGLYGLLEVALSAEDRWDQLIYPDYHKSVSDLLTDFTDMLDALTESELNTWLTEPALCNLTGQQCLIVGNALLWTLENGLQQGWTDDDPRHRVCRWWSADGVAARAARRECGSDPGRTGCPARRRSVPVAAGFGFQTC